MLSEKFVCIFAAYTTKSNSWKLSWSDIVSHPNMESRVQMSKLFQVMTTKATLGH